MRPFTIRDFAISVTGKSAALCVIMADANSANGELHSGATAGCYGSARPAESGADQAC